MVILSPMEKRLRRELCGRSGECRAPQQVRAGREHQIVTGHLSGVVHGGRKAPYKAVRELFSHEIEPGGPERPGGGSLAASTGDRGGAVIAYYGVVERAWGR